MTSGSLTKFPHLLSKKSNDDHVKSSSSYPLPALQASRQALLLAWAKILTGYCDQDETVSFISDKDRVEVDTRRWTIQARGQFKTPVPREATGIFFTPVGAARPL